MDFKSFYSKHNYNSTKGEFPTNFICLIIEYGQNLCSKYMYIDLNIEFYYIPDFDEIFK